ncbi:DUF2273 domain-containing protein [Natronospora cellulosivora (SeqCode)]
MDKTVLLQLYELFKYNKGKILGALLGFIFGLLLLFIGLWRTLVVFFCTIAGYYIGSRWDIEGNFKKLLDRILPPKKR